MANTPRMDIAQVDSLQMINGMCDALIATNQDGRILSWDAGAERLFGFAGNDAIGKPLAELLHPAEGTKEAQAWLSLAAHDGSANYETICRRRDGMALYVDVTVTTVHDPEGGIAYMLVCKKDVSELRVCQPVNPVRPARPVHAVPLAHPAHPVQGRFSAMLEVAPDAMVIVDPAGRMVLVNRQTERLFGYSREELLNQPVEILIPERFRSGHAANRTGYFADPRVRHMSAGVQLYARRKDGSEFPVEISLSPLDTQGGVLVSAAIRDITERQEQFRRVEEANRLKSEFMANMSHELRTPLNAIIGFSELLHDERMEPLSATQREFIGDILSSARHLLQLINDVLDLSKIEAGRMEFHPELLEPGVFISEVCEVTRSLSASKRIRMNVDVDPSIGPVLIDARKFKQILYNYVSNAIKFSADDGEVVVRARAEGPLYFRVEVQDHGIGIRHEDQKLLFEEFRQLDSGSTKRYPGTGLGLALTRRLVQAQGGSVGVDSTPGNGSTFFAVLPRRGRTIRA